MAHRVCVARIGGRRNRNHSRERPDRLLLVLATVLVAVHSYALPG